MSRVLLLLPALLLPLTASAGKKDKDADKAPEVDPGREIHFAAPEPVEAGGVEVSIVDALTTAELTKLKATVTNRTDDWVLFHPDEAKFIYPSGQNLAVRAGVRGTMKLKPQNNASRVLRVDGQDLQADSLEVHPGGIHMLASDSPVIELEDFQLPLAGNQVEAEGLSCVVAGKVKQETDETGLKFKCVYEGAEVVIVDPVRLQIKAEGQLFANDARNQKPVLLLPGEDTKVTAIFHVSAKVTDMQFATMHIVWNDTFRAGTPKPLDMPTLKLAVDAAKTTEQNR